MCERLAEFERAFIAYTTQFDAALVSCRDAETVVRRAAAVEHAASTLKALAAVRASEARAWKASGHRSAEEALARATGTSVNDARAALELGRRLDSQPDISTAARRGELSASQASAISDAAAADPTAGDRLLDAAKSGGSLAELKDRCAAVKAAVVDLEQRRRQIHRRRYLRDWTDGDGTWHLAAAGNPEDGAQIMAAVASHANDLFHQAREEGRREHPDTYRFDALVELARDVITDQCHPSDPGAGQRAAPDAGGDDDDQPPPPDLDRDADGNKRPRPNRKARRRRRCAPVKLLVRVDLETLMRGFPVDGDTCELVGYGPISVSAVKDLINDGDPFVAAILTKGKRVAGVAHLGRHPTAWQRSVLEWLYPTCAAEGCPARADHLQIDHRIDWSTSHITLLDWLDALCPFDHAKKTRDGWSLVDGIGKRPFVPPQDPRHPRYRPPPNPT